jgi:hypothetical protein
MRGRSSENGFGLLVALLTLAAAVGFLAALTVEMARFADESMRLEKGVRARALAEAGIEAALARIAGGNAAPFTLDLALDGGRSSVTMVPGGASTAAFVITSEGILETRGGETVSRIQVTLGRGTSGMLSVARREESVQTRRPAALKAKGG